jgi:lipopolysaccharide transport system permease protein
VLSRLVDLAITAALLGVLLVVHGATPGWGALLLPILVLVMVLASLGLGLWLAAVAVQYRDVAYGLTLAIQILMYLSPVIYPASRVPATLRPIYGLNPMAGVIEGVRSGLLGTPTMPWDLIVPGTLVSLALIVTGGLFFRRSERLFADVV